MNPNSRVMHNQTSFNVDFQREEEFEVVPVRLLRYGGRASILTEMGISHDRMTSDSWKPSLWRRQHELRSAKMHIDTSCLQIGTTAFDNAAYKYIKLIDPLFVLSSAVN